jgi:hypothetical protein
MELGSAFLLDEGEVSAEMLAQVSTFFDELFALAFDELQLARLEVRVCPCETNNSVMHSVARLSQSKE